MFNEIWFGDRECKPNKGIGGKRRLFLVNSHWYDTETK